MVVQVCSFFIPLEQGLKLISGSHVHDLLLFFLHSIRTRIKTSTLFSETKRTCSFFIPLEQGLNVHFGFLAPNSWKFRE